MLSTGRLLSNFLKSWFASWGFSPGLCWGKIASTNVSLPCHSIGSWKLMHWNSWLEIASESKLVGWSHRLCVYLLKMSKILIAQIHLVPLYSPTKPFMRHAYWATSEGTLLAASMSETCKQLDQFMGYREAEKGWTSLRIWAVRS